MSYGMTLLKKIAASPQLDLRTASVATHPELNVFAIRALLKTWDKIGWIYDDAKWHQKASRRMMYPKAKGKGK
jgi:hypothetical protein